MRLHWWLLGNGVFGKRWSLAYGAQPFTGATDRAPVSGIDRVGVSQAIESDPNCWSCQALSARLDEVERLVEKLSDEIERLAARKPKDSRASSKPPSSDGSWNKHAQKLEPLRRGRGAHIGHKGAQRKIDALAEVYGTIMVKPECDGHCRSPLKCYYSNPARSQIGDGLHSERRLGSKSKRGGEFMACVQRGVAALHQRDASLSRFVGDAARALLICSPTPKLLG